MACASTAQPCEHHEVGAGARDRSPYHSPRKLRFVTRRLRPQRVESLEDLVDFVHVLVEEGPAGWENRQTVDFLEALAAWVEDSWGGGKRPAHGIPRPDSPEWKDFAQMIAAAT